MHCGTKSRTRRNRIDRELLEVFDRIKTVIAPQAQYMRVLEDTPIKYALGYDAYDHPRRRTMMVSAVYMRKGYVSLCLGTLHMDAASAHAISPRLKEHKSGIGCFHFRELDEPLLLEVAVLAERSFEACRERGLLGERAVA